MPKRARIYIFICSSCGSKVERFRKKGEPIGPRPMCWECMKSMDRVKEKKGAEDGNDGE